MSLEIWEQPPAIRESGLVLPARCATLRALWSCARLYPQHKCARWTASQFIHKLHWNFLIRKLIQSPHSKQNQQCLATGCIWHFFIFVWQIFGPRESLCPEDSQKSTWRGWGEYSHTFRTTALIVVLHGSNLHARNHTNTIVTFAGVCIQVDTQFPNLYSYEYFVHTVRTKWRHIFPVDAHR